MASDDSPLPPRDDEIPPLPAPERLPAASRANALDAWRAAEADWAAGGSQAESAGGLDLRALWHGVRRRWPLAVALGLCCAAAAATAGWFLLEPKYTAYGHLKIASQTQSFLADTQGRQADFDLYTRTQKELLRGRFVLNAALRDPQVVKLPIVQEQIDPTTWLGSELKVDFPGNAELVRVSLTGDNPQALSALVNAVLDAYMREVVEKEKNARQERQQKLDDIFVETEEKVRSRRADLKGLVETVGSGDSAALTLKQQITLQQFGLLLQEQTRVQIELRRATIDLAAAQARLKPVEEIEVPSQDLEQLVDAHPGVAAQRDEVERLQALLSQAEGVAKPEGVARPESLRIANDYRTQIERARKSQSAQEDQARLELADLVRAEIRREAEAEVSRLGNSIEVLTAQEEGLRIDLAKITEQTYQIGKSSVEVEMMRDEIARLEKITDQLGEVTITEQIEADSPLRVTVQDRAEVPRFKDTTRQQQGTVALGLLGFVAPVFGVAWLDARRRRVSSKEQIQRVLGMRVIGSLPLLPHGARRWLGRTHRAARNSRLALRESIDGVRTMLLRESDHEPTQVIMVTSAVSGEGKTTLATQLAVSFARARCRTVLVDCDLRRPAAHRVFDLPLDPGVSEVLRGEAELADAVQPTDTENLWFVPAGICDDEALTALTQEGLAECLDGLRTDFDFVIVDCSPILPVVDALLVGRHVDAAVFSVLRDVSQTGKIQAAHERLAGLGVRVLGTVVTGTQDEVYRADYRYQTQE